MCTTHTPALFCCSDFFLCCLSCTFRGINSSNGQQLSDSWLHEFFMRCLGILAFHCACRRRVELFTGLVICDSWIRREKKVIFIFLLFNLTLFCNSGKFSPLSTLQNSTFRLVNFPHFPTFRPPTQLNSKCGCYRQNHSSGQSIQIH